MTRRHRAFAVLASVALSTLTLPGLLRPSMAADTPAPAPAAADADQAWKELQKALRPPAMPAEWANRNPTPEERAQFRSQMGDKADAAATLARQFQTRFPNHPRAAEAGRKEMEMLQTASTFGNNTQAARLEELEDQLANDPKLDPEKRFEQRLQAVQRRALAKSNESQAAGLELLEQGARKLLQDFPDRSEPFMLLLEVADESAPERGVALAKEIAQAPKADAPSKARAEALLKKLDAVGKPLALQFKAVDGRAVDLAKLRGKVVLIDFWATWCGPCVAELPNVKAAYDRLHPKGFEILGISFDKEKAKLETFVATEKMAWPQYFDGLGWKNKFGVEYGINSIPTMWLVDKQGKLRDLNARGGLAEKVEKLLAEP